MQIAALRKGGVGALAAAVLICLPAAAHQRASEAHADAHHPASLGADNDVPHSRPFDAERIEGRPGSTAIRLVEEPSERSFSNASPPRRRTPLAHSPLAIQAPASDPVEVDIPAASLRALLARTLGKDPAEPIYRHEMAALTALDARQTMRDAQGELIDFGGFRNLEGLQHAVNLTSLELDAEWWNGDRWVNLNAIEDLTPLAGLTKLTRLDLDGGAIRDVSPLANLKNLESLRLWNNEITDLSPLAGLTNLTDLGIGSNDWLSDLSPLANLPLERLSAYYNDIDDIAPLANITTLRTLSISCNNVSDIGPLASLVHLSSAGVGCNGITDISPLAGLSDLRDLYARGNQIDDISALSGLTNLRTLRLGRNDIDDIAALSSLNKLMYVNLERNLIKDISALATPLRLYDLDLRSNRISDILPLVQNSGFGHGDRVDLRSNPIGETSLHHDIPALKFRGVTVRHDESIVVAVGDQPRIYNDNVLILPIGEDLAADELHLGQYVEYFYSFFKDDFDFLVLLSNLGWAEDRTRRYLGAYFGHKNHVQGIGRPIQTSERRLQGFIHFSYYFAIASGPTLHELMHRWANFVVPAYRPHWGFTSADGILGGFSADDLVDNGDGTYYVASGFSEHGEALNNKPYSPIELYLAGFIGAEDVPDLRELKGAHVLYDDEGKVKRTKDGFPLFRADELVRHTIEDLAAEHGWRVPHHTNAQRDFRAAAILLVDPQRPATKERLDLISANVAWFSNPDWDDSSGFNFYEATGGRGTMKMDDLNAASLAPE